MKEQKEVPEKETEVGQSARKPLLLGLGFIVIGRLVIVGGAISDILVVLGLAFLIAGTVQFFKNIKAKKKSNKK